MSISSDIDKNCPSWVNEPYPSWFKCHGSAEVKYLNCHQEGDLLVAPFHIQKPSSSKGLEALP